MNARELLDILHVAERLKDTPRHCTTSNGRRESVAEHSWRVSLMALLLRHEFSGVDMDKVVDMCLIHDLGECFTGDIPAFLKTDADRELEDSLLARWVRSLPEELSAELSALYAEMDVQETAEAKLYKALDKLEAVIQHNESPIGTWSENEYELNKSYAFDAVAFSGWLTALRKEILADTLRKIEEEAGNETEPPHEITKGDTVMDFSSFRWTRQPKEHRIENGVVSVTTLPHTDLWQRTYYRFRNDNAPVFQMETEEKYFSFIVKTDFSESHHRFDQCGVVLYLDSENWLKGSVEYENEEYQHLGSVVTNHGYSDWATTEIPASVKNIWYRLSRREDDYCIECSEDGLRWKQMRICHMAEGGGVIRFGIYACSPEDSSFTARFSELQLTDCAWKAHDGQQPDE